MSEPAYRLCWPVEDEAQDEHTPGSIVRECAFCRRPVWYDPEQIIPPEYTDIPLVCVVCVLSDDEMRPGVIELWKAVRQAARWAEGGDNAADPEK